VLAGPMALLVPFGPHGAKYLLQSCVNIACTLCAEERRQTKLREQPQVKSQSTATTPREPIGILLIDPAGRERSRGGELTY
jgi:hypothetical protein